VTANLDSRRPWKAAHCVVLSNLHEVSFAYTEFLMTEPEYVDPSKLRAGPIRQESLPDDLLELIRSVYEVVGPYLKTTLEQFEIGFMRDADPASEVAVWCSITAAWSDYHEQHLDGEVLPDEDEKKLLAALIAISTGVTDAKDLGVSADVGQKLIDCYDSLGKE
jgi:hypothetical protein